MAIVKKILIAIGLIIVLLLVLALFIKKDYSVERSVTINKPVDEVFEFVKYLKNQDHYSVWAKMDPDMTQEYRGTDGTVGFVSAWEGNKDVGKGEQTIVGITDGERIDYALHFMEPYEGHADAYMTTEAIMEDQTQVAWGFTGRMPYPMNLMRVFMNMEEMIGNDLQGGLDNLKELLEMEIPESEPEPTDS